MKKFLSIFETTLTSFALLFLLYFSLFLNRAYEINSESRVGDIAFFHKSLNRYFTLETIAILMIIFLIWRFVRPTKFLKTATRLILLLVVIFIFLRYLY
jgi:hypothetical protein